MESLPVGAKPKSKGIDYVGLAILLLVFLFVGWSLYATHTKSKVPDATHKLHQCQSHLQQVGDALELYAKTHGGHFPANLTELKFVIPPCPEVGRNTFGDYEISADAKSFSMGCVGSNHDFAFRWEGGVVSPNYPRYRSGEGLVRPTDDQPAKR